MSEESTLNIMNRTFLSLLLGLALNSVLTLPHLSQARYPPARSHCEPRRER
ncbi:MAG: hypothetical protein J5971_08930 [Prevotella sp.]|nr:hypothetical protein [Prevotella sp.]